MTAESGRVEILLRDPEVVGALLDEILLEMADIATLVVTSKDGIVIAGRGPADESGHLPDHASALAAAANSIGGNFVDILTPGRLQSALFESTRGCVGVYPLTSTILLVLGSALGVSLGRFMAAAKKAIAALQRPQERRALS